MFLLLLMSLSLFLHQAPLIKWHQAYINQTPVAWALEEEPATDKRRQVDFENSWNRWASTNGREHCRPWNRPILRTGPSHRSEREESSVRSVNDNKKKNLLKSCTWYENQLTFEISTPQPGNHPLQTAEENITLAFWGQWIWEFVLRTPSHCLEMLRDA